MLIDKKMFKTALAVFLSVLVANLFKLQSPFFVAIAVVFCMDSSFYTSYRAGFYRMCGTLAGAVVGILFVLIQPDNALLCGVGILAVILICRLFHIEKTIPTAGVVFAAVMLSLGNKNPFTYSLNRVIDTFVGIIIAVAVSYAVFPKENILKIRKNIRSISGKIQTAAIQFLSAGEKVDFDSLRDELVGSIHLLDDYKKEFNPKIKENSDLMNITEELMLLRMILKHLDTISELKPMSILNKDNIKRLAALNTGIIQDGSHNDNQKNTESIIYNYHVKKLLDALFAIQNESGKIYEHDRK